MYDTAKKKFFSPSYFHFISLKSRQKKCAKGKKIYTTPLEIFFCKFFFSHQSQHIKRIFRYLLMTDRVLETWVSGFASAIRSIYFHRKSKLFRDNSGTIYSI